MTITFAPYQLNSGTFKLRRKPRLRMSDRQSAFVLHRQPQLAMNSTSVTHVPMLLARPQPRLRMSELSTVFLLERPAPEMAMTGDAPLPQSTVFLLNRPAPRLSMTTGLAMHVEMTLHHQPRLLMSPAARFFLTRQPRLYMTDGHTTLARQALLIQQPEIYASMVQGLTITVTSGLDISTDSRYRLVIVVAEAIRVSGHFTVLLNQLKQLVDTAGFGGDADAFLRAIIADIFTLADTPAGALALALQIIDALSMHAGPAASQEALALVSAVLALRDAAAPVDKVQLTDLLSMTDSMVLDWFAYAKALDAIRLDAAPNNTLLLSAVIAESLAVGDTAVNIVELLLKLRETLGFAATISIGDETYTAWVMNVENQAFTQYEDFPFNSFAKFNDDYLAVSAEGVYVLEGDDDDGEAINSRVRWGLAGVGNQKLNRVEMAYLGLATDGTMGLKAITTSPEGDKIAYYYQMNLRPSVDVRENRIKIGKGLQSVYWGWELTNVDGAWFALHDFNLLPMQLSRRIRRE